jgi:hypothetical protein
MMRAMWPSGESDAASSPSAASGMASSTTFAAAGMRYCAVVMTRSKPAAAPAGRPMATARVRPPDRRLISLAITLGEASAQSTRSGQGGESLSFRSKFDSTGISGPRKASVFTS